ncbi:ketoacyl-ACP synthase III family protein [Streptomyces broussonetiae]|uniref:Ketoacyl-ACP synthase III family protein n=1 Tax=Streptomyces broussonetiae TaxID=2686304 RepID=A0ABV5ECS3_9ACTN
MKLNGIYLTGVGVHLPEQVPLEDAVAQGDCDEAQLTTGWRAARVAGTMPAPDMAIEAGKQALARSGHTPGDIDLLLHTSTSHQGPDSWMPQHYILRNTVDREVPAIGLRQGCEGFLAGAELAACYLMASPDRTAAMITTADNFGHPLIDRYRSHHGLVLGDGGTAAVLSKREGFAEVLAVNSFSVPALEGMTRGDEPLFPPGCTVGRKITLERQATSRPGDVTPQEAVVIAGKVEAEAVRQVLDDAGIEIADITRVIHPAAANELYLEHFLKPLGVGPSHGMLEFGRWNGHMGASDLLAGFDHLVGAGDLRPGDHVMMFAVGPGMAMSYGVIRILGTPGWVAS